MTRTVHCIKLDKEAEGLDFPPTPGKLGERIYESVSKEAWQAWLAHQTMLINENQLRVVDPEARKFSRNRNGEVFLRRRLRNAGRLRRAQKLDA